MKNSKIDLRHFGFTQNRTNSQDVDGQRNFSNATNSGSRKVNKAIVLESSSDEDDDFQPTQTFLRYGARKLNIYNTQTNNISKDSDSCSAKLNIDSIDTDLGRNAKYVNANSRLEENLQKLLTPPKSSQPSMLSGTSKYSIRNNILSVKLDNSSPINTTKSNDDNISNNLNSPYCSSSQKENGIDETLLSSNSQTSFNSNLELNISSTLKDLSPAGQKQLEDRLREKYLDAEAITDTAYPSIVKIKEDVPLNAAEMKKDALRAKYLDSIQITDETYLEKKPNFIKSKRESPVQVSDTEQNTKTSQPPQNTTQISIVFDDTLQDYMTSVFRNAPPGSSSESDLRILKADLNYNRNTYVELLEKYCNVIDQIPAEFFKPIDGFEANTFLKLKTLRQKFKAKIKLSEKRLEKVERESVKRLSADNDSFPDSLYDEEQEILAEQNNDRYIEKLAIEDEYLARFGEEETKTGRKIDSNDISTEILEKTPVKEYDNRFSDFHTSYESIPDGPYRTPELNTRVAPKFQLLSNFSEIIKKSESPALKDIKTLATKTTAEENVEKRRNIPKETTTFIDLDDSNSSDVEEIINNVRDESLINEGRKSDYNNLSCGMLEAGRESNFKKPSEPRITFPTDSLRQQSSQLIELNDTNVDLDDDGWEKYNIEDFTEAPLSSRTDINNSDIGFSKASDFMERENNEMNILLETISSPISSTANSSATSQRRQGAIAKFHNNVKNDGITGEFDGFRFEHSERMQLAFHEYFGLKEFRPVQLQAINAALLGNDCFILMPTGGGKSLCYQLPAVITEGVTIVISPLKSLILDQVNKLSSLDIYAKNLSGEQTMQEQNGVYVDLSCSPPRIKLLYVTPEKISGSPKLQDHLDKLYSKNYIARFVIDEAHCVSQWGHDFRPDYKKLRVLRERFPRVPMMLLTATATPRVRLDILHQLSMRSCKWFLSSFNRSNLKYLVLQKKGASTVEEIAKLIRTKFNHCCGIVYCLARKDCEKVADDLKKLGIRAAGYHAGLADKIRESTQKDWITNKFQVICATIAFGMGIDKPDVRFVFHFSLPKSIEGYYQESGRAGRDGELAYCILYYNYSDMFRYKKMIDMDKPVSLEVKQIHYNNLHKIVGYCENVTDCRRAQQLDYFGEYFTSEECLENRQSACDNCLKKKEYKTIDVTDHCKLIGRAVRDLCSGSNRFTLLHMVDIFKGSQIKKIVENRHDKTNYHGHLKMWDKSDIQRLFHKLVIEEYLREELIFTRDIPQAYLRLGAKVDKLMTNTVKLEFSVKESIDSRKPLRIEVETAKTSPIAIFDDKTNKNVQDLYERCHNELLEKCRNIAAQKNCTMASIMNMQALHAMSKKLPQTEMEMLAIPHVTKANFLKYGQQFLDITRNYAAEHLCILLDYEESKSKETAEAASVVSAAKHLSRPATSSRSVFVDDDGADAAEWGRLSFQASQSTSSSTGKVGGGRGRNRAGRGFKRKASSGTFAAKSTKRARKQASKSPKKRTNSAGGGGRPSYQSAAAGKFGSSGGFKKEPAQNSGFGFKMLPVPVLKKSA